MSRRRVRPARLGLAGSQAGHDEGAIALMVAVLLTFGLVAFVAVTVDVGALYSYKRQMQTAADAAALAGVQNLPNDPGGAETVAEEYASVNSPKATASVDTARTFVDHDTITVDLLDPEMGLFFARAIPVGLETAPVGARAKAVIGSPTVYGSGLMPIGLMPMAGAEISPWGYSAGELIELKYAEGTTGNYAYLNLTAFDNPLDPNDIKKFIGDGGTEKPLGIGDTFPPDPGIGQAATNYFANQYFKCADHGLERLVYDVDKGVYEPVHEDGTPCPRLLACPVVINTDPDNRYTFPGGASFDMECIGFVNMLVEQLKKNDKTIWARFVQVVPADTLDPGGYVDYAGVVYWLAE